MNMDKIQNITDKVISSLPKAIPVIFQMETNYIFFLLEWVIRPFRL